MKRFILLAALLCALSPLARAETIEPIKEVPDHALWLLETASGEIGYAEDRRVTKYGEWAGEPTAEWCAEFLCWCVDQVDAAHGTQLLETVYPRYSGSNTGRDWFIREGRYVARTGRVEGWGTQWLNGETEALDKNGYIPQPGDWVFFTWTADVTSTDHVAMVEFCERREDGGVNVHVIEGNNPDRVQRNVYGLGDWRILGYGTVYDMAGIVMQSGNSGKKVAQLQETLCLIGLLDADNVSGTYRAGTVQAVKELQRMQGLSATGVATRETQLALADYFAAWMRSQPDYWLVIDE